MKKVRNRPGVNIIQRQNKPGLLPHWVGGVAPTSPCPHLRKVGLCISCVKGDCEGPGDGRIILDCVSEQLTVSIQEMGLQGRGWEATLCTLKMETRVGTAGHTHTRYGTAQRRDTDPPWSSRKITMTLVNQ